MFQPSQHDVRRFFCETRRKQREALPLTPMEAVAADWIAVHSEHHAELDDPAAALESVYEVRAPPRDKPQLTGPAAGVRSAVPAGFKQSGMATFFRGAYRSS